LAIDHYFKGKVNKYPKCISLGNIYRNFLREKKKVTNFFNSFLYLHKSDIKNFLK